MDSYNDLKLRKQPILLKDAGHHTGGIIMLHQAFPGRGDRSNLWHGGGHGHKKLCSQSRYAEKCLDAHRPKKSSRACSPASMW